MPRGLYFSKALLERLIFGGAYIQRGFSTDSLIVGSKFTVFALLCFVFEGNFPSTSPRGAYISRGDLTEGFLRYRIGRLIFGGAYTWRGLFSEFYGIYERNEFDAVPKTILVFISTLKYPITDVSLKTLLTVLM